MLAILDSSNVIVALPSDAHYSGGILVTPECIYAGLNEQNSAIANVPAEAMVGDTFANDVLSSVSLQLAKQARKGMITDARHAATFGTFDHAGKTFSCDHLSRSDIDGLNGYVALTGSLPQEWFGAWKAVDNTFLPIASVADWVSLYTSMLAAGNAAFVHSEQCKAQIDAATTIDEVNAINW